MADIAEQICLAIDEIVSQRLRGIRADITVTAEIADNTDAAKGKYICSTGTAQFVAFSTDTSYKIGDSVQVTVPNGNYDEQKTIVGKYIKADEEGKPYVYESSFDRLIDASGNLLAVSPQKLPSPMIAGLIANDTEKFEIPVWSWVLDSNSPHVGYTRLGLKGQFRSLLQNYNPISGDYGYRLEVVSCKESTTTSADKNEVLLALNLYQDIIKNQNVETWDNRAKDIPNDWYKNWLQAILGNASLKGSLENLLTGTTITEETDGKTLYVELLQLESATQQLQGVQRQITRLLLATNTLLSNIKLDSRHMFGNPYNFQSFFEQEIVTDISSVGEIYGYVLYFYETPGSFKYLNNEGKEAEIPIPKDSFDEPTNQSNLYSKDPYICLGYDVSEFDTEKIILYTINGNTYNVNEEDSKKLIRLRWVHKTDSGVIQMTEEDLVGMDYEIRWYQYSLGVASADVYSGVYWKRVGEKDSKSLMFGFTPDTNLQQEQIKAILFYTDEDGNQQIVRSNILTFTNEQEVPNQATIEAIKGLSIVCLDDRNGNYFCYGQDGRFLETEKLSTNTVLKVEPRFITSDRETAIENDAVKWYFPIDNTMLEVYGDWKEENGWYVLENIKQAEYRLKSRYFSSYINNTIKCEVALNGRTYSTTKDFHFGSVGTSGTDVTLVIDLSDVALTDDGQKESIIATARLYDSSYSEIDLLDRSKFNPTITWKWFDTTDKSSYIEDLISDGIKCEISPKQDGFLNAKILPILQVTLSGWGNYDLTAYKAIPIRSDKKYTGVLATTEVIYDSAGYSGYPTYYKEKHWLYESTNDGVVTTNAVWGIYNPYSDDGDMPYWGSFGYDKNNIPTNIFKPAPFYVENVRQYGSKAEIDEETVWLQPIVTLQNRYPSAVTNKWDGTSLELNETNSTILAAAIAAGKKESDNTFSGVMLGNWEGTNTEGSITENTGVYGFHYGAQSYAFKDDGTALIGKSGRGRIIFEGNKGTIQSQSWKAHQHGMCLDLDDGIIDMQYGLKYESVTIDEVDISSGKTYYTYTPSKYVEAAGSIYNDNYIYYKKDNEGNYNFIAKDAISYQDNDTTKEIIDSSVYYYLEEQYNPVEKEDLEKGKAYYTITALNTDRRYMTLSVTDSRFPLAIGKEAAASQRKFRVAWDGTCYIVDGIFSGSIDAEYGYLGDLYVYGSIEVSRNGSISSGKSSLNDDTSGFWLDKTGFHIGNSYNSYFNNLKSSIFYNNGSKMKLTGGGIELFKAADIESAITEEEDISFAQLGWDSSDEASYSYLRLGRGTSTEGSIQNAGIIKKYSKGLWIGNNDTSDTWTNGYLTNPETGIGIFINIIDGGIYYSDSKNETINKELGVAYFA